MQYVYLWYSPWNNAQLWTPTQHPFLDILIKKLTQLYSIASLSLSTTKDVFLHYPHDDRPRHHPRYHNGRCEQLHKRNWHWNDLLPTEPNGPPDPCPGPRCCQNLRLSSIFFQVKTVNYLYFFVWDNFLVLSLWEVFISGILVTYLYNRATFKYLNF